LQLISFCLSLDFLLSPAIDFLTSLARRGRTSRAA
jgi:hypothetical protein